MQLSYSPHHYPTNYPIKMSGKLTYKVIQKKDYHRFDGTSALYIQIFLEGKRKRIPLDIFVKPKMFNEQRQLVKGNSQLAKDYNGITTKNYTNL